LLRKFYNRIDSFISFNYKKFIDLLGRFVQRIGFIVYLHVIIKLHLSSLIINTSLMFR